MLFFLLCTCISHAQVLPKYLILFKDKADSPYTLTDPQAYLSEKAIARRHQQHIPVSDSDIPVSKSYLEQLAATGVKISLVTKWLNGAVVEADDEQLEKIRILPFFKAVARERPFNSRGGNRYSRIIRQNDKLEVTEDWDAGSMERQLDILGIPELFQENIKGEGIIIAVLDAGFINVNQIPYFTSLFEENRVIDTWDFVEAGRNVYRSHTHGTQVLSTMAAFEPGSLIGAAPKASYALYRTENNASETPLEEINWLCAAERADSLGADIISSSLGYNYYDDPDDSYTYDDMDGNTSILSQAARWAVRKGILVVNSVGNEGNDAWQYLLTPADVDSVLSVGATSYLLQKAGFSSRGPNASGLLKPDVAAVGQGVVLGSTSVGGGIATGNGTSFSAPQISGFAALLWQKYPALSVMQLADLIRKSGHLAQQPDNELGYGVPDYTKAKQVYESEYLVTGIEPAEKQEWVIYPNPVDDELIISSAVNGGTVTYPESLGLSDVTGRALPVNTLRRAEGATVDVSHLPPGMYFLQIVNKNKEAKVYKVIRK